MVVVTSAGRYKASVPAAPSAPVPADDAVNFLGCDNPGPSAEPALPPAPSDG